MKRSRIRPVSKRRAAQAGARNECRTIVLSRDVLCRGGCGRAATEVHELGRGAYRQSCWLDPELCIGLCRGCHQWVTENPTKAQEARLALAGWEVEALLKSRE